jgi:hypothetical protein
MGAKMQITHRTALVELATVMPIEAEPEADRVPNTSIPAEHGVSEDVLCQPPSNLFANVFQLFTPYGG